jgi:hypothetical protein
MKIFIFGLVVLSSIQGYSQTGTPKSNPTVLKYGIGTTIVGAVTSKFADGKTKQIYEKLISGRSLETVAMYEYGQSAFPKSSIVGMVNGQPGMAIFEIKATPIDQGWANKLTTIQLEENIRKSQAAIDDHLKSLQASGSVSGRISQVAHGSPGLDTYKSLIDMEYAKIEKFKKQIKAIQNGSFKPAIAPMNFVVSTEHGAQFAISEFESLSGKTKIEKVVVKGDAKMLAKTASKYNKLGWTAGAVTLISAGGTIYEYLSSGGLSRFLGFGNNSTSNEERLSGKEVDVNGVLVTDTNNVSGQ